MQLEHELSSDSKSSGNPSGMSTQDPMRDQIPSGAKSQFSHLLGRTEVMLGLFLAGIAAFIVLLFGIIFGVGIGTIILRLILAPIIAFLLGFGFIWLIRFLYPAAFEERAPSDLSDMMDSRKSVDASLDAEKPEFLPGYISGELVEDDTDGPSRVASDTGVEFYNDPRSMAAAIRTTLETEDK